MRTFVMGTVLGTLMATMSLAQSGPQVEIETTIQNQMEAFRSDNFAEAYSYASPMIQGMFGDANRFGMMVQRGYPMVWRNQTVRYLELREIAGQLWQKVMIQDASGGLHMLDYQMIQTEEGTWQINGVQLLPSPDIGA
ncbi:DUF4864 domain-containing protein [Algirhabdus cladophorae]|uniref:DUF4864 domain-containing protein n=1 Tax=Algirhabdus cladophorae TaxID=3377108 RepID=UPI003B84704D